MPLQKLCIPICLEVISGKIVPLNKDVLKEKKTDSPIGTKLQLNKTVCKTKSIKPKSPKTPHFSVVFFFESTRGIVHRHREKKARVSFQ